MISTLLWAWSLMQLPLYTPALAVSMPAGPSDSLQIKNVILLIGDGMGLSQLSAAYYYSPQDEIPNFSRFSHIGLITTSSCDEKITDSAAGATAFSTGQKTANGRIGMDKKKNSLELLPEWLMQKGMSSGLVSTSSITHATPASFFAHEASRHHQYEIAEQMPQSPIRYFAGGGLKFFTEKFNDDLLEEMAEEGWQIEKSFKDLSGTPEDARYGFLLASDGMPRMDEGRGDFLRQACVHAMDFLSKDADGFFLMAEASQIDWGGHANNAQYIIDEVLDFDQAIGAVLDFAEKDGQTLVIVTADHETGGFSLNAAEKKVPFRGVQRDYDEIEPGFSTGGHTASLVPVLAFGPGAEMFSGIYPNTEIHAKIKALLQP